MNRIEFKSANAKRATVRSADLNKLSKAEVIAIARSQGLLVCKTKKAAIKAIEMAEIQRVRFLNKIADTKAGNGHSAA
jgi:hypothetical protein